MKYFLKRFVWVMENSNIGAMFVGLLVGTVIADTQEQLWQSQAFMLAGVVATSAVLGVVIGRRDAREEREMVERKMEILERLFAGEEADS